MFPRQPLLGQSSGAADTYVLGSQILGNAFRTTMEEYFIDMPLDPGCYDVEIGMRSGLQ